MEDLVHEAPLLDVPHERRPSVQALDLFGRSSCPPGVGVPGLDLFVVSSLFRSCSAVRRFALNPWRIALGRCGIGVGRFGVARRGAKWRG